MQLLKANRDIVVRRVLGGGAHPRELLLKLKIAAVLALDEAKHGLGSTLNVALFRVGLHRTWSLRCIVIPNDLTSFYFENLLAVADGL